MDEALPAHLRRKTENLSAPPRNGHLHIGRPRGLRQRLSRFSIGRTTVMPSGATQLRP
jgi:hypothetical protein